MLNYKAIEKLLTGETEKESKVIRPEVFKDQTAFNTVMSNCQRIGGKRFCCIPLELLEIDEDYQRVYCINMEKVYSNGTSTNVSQFWYPHIQKQQHLQ